MPLDTLLKQSSPAPKANPRQTVAEDTEQLAMSTLSFQNYVRERMLRRRNEELSEELSPESLPTFARKKQAMAAREHAPCPAALPWSSTTPCAAWP